MPDPVLYLVLSEPVLLRDHLLHTQPVRGQVPQHDHGRRYRAGRLHPGLCHTAVVGQTGAAVWVSAYFWVHVCFPGFGEDVP